MSNSDILREFLLETQENLALLDGDLVKLEKNPTEKSTLAQVFRTLHSVKGAAGFIGLPKLQAVAHSAESLLSRLRNGELVFDRPIATALLGVVDAIREVLIQIEKDGTEGAGDYAALILELDRLREGSSEVATPSSAPQPSLPTQSSVSDQPPPPRSKAATRLPLGSLAKEVLTPAKPLGVPPLPMAPQPVSSVSTAEFSPGPESSPSAAAQTAIFSPSEIFPETVKQVGKEPTKQTGAATLVADSNIRVDVSLLDNLMTLMGELVLARNQILQFSTTHQDEGYLSAVQRLNQLTSALQASVMKTRMQPIGSLFGKFHRIVRDLAVACGKSVDLEMYGQDTELDKSLLEAIRDPVTHLVRNAIDHGIEPAETRRERGKSEVGRLRMLAYHEGGKVVIEISDDGGGVYVDRVRDKAVSAGLVSADAIARMSRQEIMRLIFLPGFSTAEKVTQFSGRGVGMDVVRTNIEKIGGTIDIESPPGQGTTIRTKIPLTLAIIPALIVVTGEQRFAIPQVSLLELVHLDEQHASTGVERIHGAPVYRLRGDLLPLVFLDEQLEIESQRTSAEGLLIIVVQADDRPFGLVVDALRDTEEIVVKPLQKLLKNISVFAGAAIMGDGQVALVLDVAGLARHAQVISGAKGGGTIAEPSRPALPTSAETRQLLLFSPTAGGQMAIPLAQVARLEEAPRAAIEQLGDRQVIQYRGAVLPLIDVSRELDWLRTGARAQRESSQPASELAPIIVYSIGQDHVGLLIDRILDIVPDPGIPQGTSSRPGVLHTSIVQEKVTEFVDVQALAAGAIHLPFPSDTVGVSSAAG